MRLFRHIPHIIYEIGWMLGSAAFAASLMLFVWAPYVVGMLMLVIIFHEMAHYYTAKATGHGAYLPFFIPLGFAALGGTYIKDLPEGSALAYTAAAGPLGGAFVGAAMAIVSILINFPPGMVLGFFLAGFELFNLGLGSDGKKLRKGLKDARK